MENERSETWGRVSWMVDLFRIMVEGGVGVNQGWVWEGVDDFGD